jgi:HSP20 family protein
MSLKKLIPWNWFKKEEEDSGQTIPVQRNMDYDRTYAIGNPIGQLHHEMERLFDRFFQGFGIGRSGYESLPFSRLTDGLLKPTLDLGATDKNYTVTVEIPGVDEKDIKLEIINDTLTIRGEKKQETEEKDKNFYRLERSYGSFQRVLSLPGDIDQDGVKANFKKGILTVTMPRKALPKADVKQIAVNVA